jgi:hypothetical protein
VYARQAVADLVRHLLLGLRLRVDEDVAHVAAGHWGAIDRGLDVGAHRGVADARDGDLEVDVVVEPRRAEQADGGLGDDHVGAGREHVLVVADPLPPELGDEDVEVREPVGVEDDALRIALAEADADRVSEGLCHRRPRLPASDLAA